MDRVFQIDKNVLFDCLRMKILTKDGELSLGCRESSILLLLIQHRNQIISKEAIQAKAWGKVIVGETSLTKAISNLRKLLHTAQCSSYEIKTIPKEGYGLIGISIESEDVTNLEFEKS